MTKRTLLLLAVLAALALAAWQLSRRASASTLDAALSDFAIADTARVDRIFISDRQGRSIDLRRTPQGWVVNGLYPARQPEVTTALKTFLRIEVKSPVPKSAEPMALRTMAAHSTRVEIYTGGAKPEKIWIIGHATKDHFGTHMILEKPGVGRSSAPFVMGMSGFTGVLNTRFPTDVDNWRSPAVFRFPDLHSLAAVEVRHPARPAASYRIEQPEGGPPRLTSLDGRPLPMDTVLVQAALLPFKEFNFENIDRRTRGAKRDSLLAAAPSFEVTAFPRAGAPQTMKLWLMPYTGEHEDPFSPKPLHDPLRMWALVQDTLLVTVQREKADIITQPASAFLP